MTKSDLITQIAEKASLTQKDSALVINAVFDAMAASLARGERIEIRGFASWGIKTRDARQGRNPKTGESVLVPAKRVIHFKPGKEMVGRLNDGTLDET